VIVWNRTDLSVRIEGDVQNITDHVNVIDFAGVFSGNAVTPPRAAFARVQTSF
jgi:hypothetical protein